MKTNKNYWICLLINASSCKIKEKLGKKKIKVAGDTKGNIKFFSLSLVLPLDYNVIEKEVRI